MVLNSALAAMDGGVSNALAWSFAKQNSPTQNQQEAFKQCQLALPLLHSGIVSLITINNPRRL